MNTSPTGKNNDMTVSFGLISNPQVSKFSIIINKNPPISPTAVPINLLVAIEENLFDFIKMKATPMLQGIK
jgi:hypothetical protein